MTDMVINQAAIDHRSTEDKGQEEGCSGIGRAGLSCVAENEQVVAFFLIARFICSYNKHCVTVNKLMFY
jgi:hypothetical protein